VQWLALLISWHIVTVICGLGSVYFVDGVKVSLPQHLVCINDQNKEVLCGIRQHYRLPIQNELLQCKTCICLLSAFGLCHLNT
jgi:hypothetical protein